MSRHDDRPILRTLVGYAYPALEPVGTDGRRCLRKWVVRSARALPDQPELDRLADTLAREVTETIREAYAPHTPADKLQAAFPSGSLLRIDDLHVVAVIEIPSPEHEVNDATLIGTWGFLRGVDRDLGIEDLQGVPKRFWFPLGGKSRLGGAEEGDG